MYIKHFTAFSKALLIISITICKSAISAGYVTWKVPGLSAIQRVSIATGENIVFYENHIDTLPKYTLNYEIDPSLLDLNGHLFQTSTGLKAFFAGTGKVFQLDTASLEIKRIDETVHHGYNFDSYQFVRNDTVFSFGGYGFWIQNNLLTYYSEVRKEWNLYSTALFEMSAPDYNVSASEIRFYDRVHDIFYVIHKNELIEYNFSSRQWRSLGSTLTDYSARNRYMVHPASDTTVLLMSTRTALVVDMYRNRVSDVTMENGAILSSGISPFGFQCAYDASDGLLLPKYSDKLRSGYYFESVKDKNLVKAQFTSLYKESAGGYQSLLIASFVAFTLCAIFLTVFLRGRYQKRRNAIFDTVQWEVLERSAAAPLTTYDFNEVLGLTDSSWEVQRRKRSEFIKGLNSLALQQFGSEVLLRVRSEEDKRQILYHLNPRLESVLARLL